MIGRDNYENTMGQCFTSLRHHLDRVRDRVSHWISNSETLGAMRTRWHQRTERQPESRRIAELELELTTQREEVTRLTGQLNDRDSQRRQLSARVTELENEVTALRRSTEQRNNLQSERNCDWAITENEIQIKRDQELGSGAWGTVYRGEFHGCDVAVKEMHPILLNEIISERNRQLFEREVDIASRCRHPCLLQFIGATTGESLLLVTEIMDCSLREQLPYIPSAPRLSDQNIIIISLDVAKALNYLHQKREPIIHHDISSSNVLLWRQGDHWRAKVSDYGTANFVRQNNINYPGALIYCAPESRNQDPQTRISLKVSNSTFNVGCLAVT